MPDLTPTALRDHVLRAVGTLSGMEPGKPVRAAEVVSAALESAGISPDTADDYKKASSNANWVGTQSLRAAGLLGPADKRGWWVLTPAGVSALTGEAPTKAETPPLPAMGQVPLPPPFPPFIAPSTWAGDEAGVVVFTTPTADTYAEDSYVRCIAVSHTPCFGGYSETDATCACCPISKSCRSSLFGRLHAIGTALHERDELEAARRIPRSGTAPKIIRSEESITDILDILEAGGSGSSHRPAIPPAMSDENGVEIPAQVDSICYKCTKTIKEGAVCMWVPSLGARHKGACP